VRSLPRSLGASQLGQIATVVLLACCAAYAVSSSAILIPQDGGLYLSVALNLTEGRGLALPSGEAFVQKPPLFAAMLALVFKLAGPTTVAASLVPRLFAGLNVVLVFMLARRLGSRPVYALCAAVLFSSSHYFARFAQSVLLETALIAATLCSLALLIDALESRRIRSYAIAAGALAMSFYLKQTALVLAPIPLVVWAAVPSVRARAPRLGLPVFYAAFFALIAPWYIHASRVGSPATGEAYYRGILELARASPGLLLEAAEHFVRYNLVAELNAVELVVFVAGLTCLVSRAIRRSVPHLVLLLAWLASFAVAWPAVGICGFDIRQFIVSTTLSYVAVGGCCDWAVRVLAPPDRGATAVAVARGLVIGLVLAASWVGVEDGSGLRSSLRDKQLLAANDDSQRMKGLRRFLRAHVAPGATILSSWNRQYLTYFFTGGRYPVRSIPIEALLDGENPRPSVCVSLFNDPVLSTSDRSGARIFSKDRATERNRAFEGDIHYVLYEATFWQAIERYEADLVLYRHNAEKSPRELERYLDDSDRLERLYSDDEAVVYSVIRPWR